VLPPAGRMPEGVLPKDGPGGVGFANTGALLPKELGPPKVDPLAVMMPDVVPPAGAPGMPALPGPAARPLKSGETPAV